MLSENQSSYLHTSDISTESLDKWSPSSGHIEEKNNDTEMIKQAAFPSR